MQRGLEALLQGFLFGLAAPLPYKQRFFGELLAQKAQRPVVLMLLAL